MRKRFQILKLYGTNMGNDSTQFLERLSIYCHVCTILRGNPYEDIL